MLGGCSLVGGGYNAVLVVLMFFAGLRNIVHGLIRILRPGNEAGVHMNS